MPPKNVVLILLSAFLSTV